MGDKSPLNSPVSTSQTGIITVNRPLDREQIPEYRLTISVKDNPENPRIARRVRLQGGVEGHGSAGFIQVAWPRLRCTAVTVSKCSVQIPFPPISGCVALASQFSLASTFSSAKWTHAKIMALKEPVSVKSLAQCLAHGKHSVNTSYHLFSSNH